MNYNITLNDKFFNQADDLENTLHSVGAKITAGVYQKGTNYIEDNVGRKMGECFISEKPLTLVQCFKAGHDTNGNRLAIFVQYDLNGVILAVYKYGNKIPSAIVNNSYILLPDVNVTKSELKEWIKDAKQSNRIQFVQGE